MMPPEAKDCSFMFAIVFVTVTSLASVWNTILNGLMMAEMVDMDHIEPLNSCHSIDPCSNPGVPEFFYTPILIWA